MIVQDVALSPRPQDDSIFLKERDRIIAAQSEQIRLLTAEVAKLMTGIDRVEVQVDVMQAQVRPTSPGAFAHTATSQSRARCGNPILLLRRSRTRT